MTTLPNCPKCDSEFTYEDGSLLICPMCAHEWNPEGESLVTTHRDVNGNILQGGDTVTIVKDLKVKGSSSILKMGTRVKNIRLIEESDHNIECKIDGFGAMKLKSEFVKKI